MLFAIEQLFLEFAVLLELLCEGCVGRGGLDAKLEVTGTGCVTERRSIIAGFDVVGDEVSWLSAKECQFEVPRTGPGFGIALNGGVPEEFGDLTGLTIDGVVEGDIAEEEVGVFGFDEEWDGGVGGDVEIAGGIEEADDGRLIDADIDGVHGGLGIRLALGIGDGDTVEFGSGTIFADGEVPAGGELCVIDGDGDFFAFAGEGGITGQLEDSVFQGAIGFSDHGHASILPCGDGGGRLGAWREVHVVGVGAANFGDARGGWLSDIDLKGLADGVAGDDAVLKVLSDAAVVFAGHDDTEATGVIGWLQGERFIDEAAVAGGVQQLDGVRDVAGDIDLEFDSGAGGDGGISGTNFVKHGDCGNAGLSEREGPEEADGFGTEDGVEAGDECEDEQGGAKSGEPAAIDDFVDVDACEADGGAFFEDAADGLPGITSGGLKINECGEAAVESCVLAVEHAGSEDGVDVAGEPGEDEAVEDKQAAEQHSGEEDGSGERCETAADDPVIKQCEDEDVADEQQRGDEGGGEQIGGFNAALGERQLVADELVGFDELILLWFGDGGHDRTFVKKPRKSELSLFYRLKSGSGSQFAGNGWIRQSLRIATRAFSGWVLWVFEF